MVRKPTETNHGKAKQSYQAEVLYSGVLGKDKNYKDLYFDIVQFVCNQGVRIDGIPPGRHRSWTTEHKYISHIDGATVRVKLADKDLIGVKVEICSNNSIDGIVSKLTSKFHKLKLISEGSFKYRQGFCGLYDHIKYKKNK